jgi:hypothetical protein
MGPSLAICPHVKSVARRPRDTHHDLPRERRIALSRVQERVVEELSRIGGRGLTQKELSRRCNNRIGTNGGFRRSLDNAESQGWLKSELVFEGTPLEKKRYYLWKPVVLHLWRCKGCGVMSVELEPGPASRACACGEDEGLDYCGLYRLMKVEPKERKAEG